jgi:hypothetical protein
VRTVVSALMAVLSLTACGGAAGGAGAQGTAGRLDGVVLSGPSCPVERAGSPCPPRPVAAADITVSRGGDTIARTRTDTLGRFVVRLGAGTYTVVARSPGALATTASAHVRITSGVTAQVTLTVDSGIR